MKTKILILLNTELSRSQIVDVLTVASVYKDNGIISSYEYSVIFDCAVSRMSDEELFCGSIP